MTIAEVDLFRYELPLTAPLWLDDTPTRHRRGLLVRLRTGRGPEGWGEAAPLPGFSAETLADVVAHAQSVVPRWLETSIPSPNASLSRSLRALSYGEACPASFRFAAESAVVDLLASAGETNLPALLGTPRPSVELNALISEPTEDGVGQAAWFRDAGYRAVKVKVGRGSVSDEAEQIRAIRDELGNAVALRLDANRAWSLETALTFSEAIRDVEVRYLEEPLADPSRLGEFVAQADLPVALDETTRAVSPEALEDGPSVAAVILKPTLLGGLRRTQEWSKTAEAQGSTPVLSAAYESGVGIRMLVALAATGPDTPVGLSTYDRLGADLLTPRPRFQGPTIEVETVTNPRTRVDEDQLAPLLSVS